MIGQTGDLQTRMLTDIGGTLVALDRVTQRIQKMEMQTRSANQAMRNLQQQATKNLTVGHGAAMTGRALARSGGGVFGRVLGGASMGGGFGTLAVAAGVAGVALRMYTSAVEQNIENIRMSSAAQKEYTQAIASGKKVIEQQAKAGYSRAGARRGLLAAGGQSAVDAAAKLEGSDFAFGGGVGSTVVQAAFAKHGDTERARSAIKSVSRLVKAGMPVNEAMKVIESGSALDSAESTARLETRLYDTSTGSRGSYARAQQNLDLKHTGSGFVYGGSREDSLIGSANESNRQSAKMSQFEIDAAISDNGFNAAEEVRRAANPVATALDDLAKTRREHIALMSRMADAEGNFYIALKDFGKNFGGQGSMTDQRRRQQEAFNQD